MAQAAAPQLVPLKPSPVTIPNDVLQIRYRGAKLKLLSGVDMRPHSYVPFSRYDCSEQGSQLLHRLRIIPIIFLSSNNHTA